MASRSGCERTGMSMSPKLWFALVLVLLVGSAQAGREVPKQQWAHRQRLQPYSDPRSNEARHAPPVQSFLVSDGSWVDCIPIEGQIAAHHPSLKDHVIQMPPSLGARSPERHPQLFAQEHGGCPEGSIPVLRDDPSRKLMHKSGPPVSRWTPKKDVTHEHIELVTAAYKHEYAVTGVPYSPHSYSGARSFFSVNNPTLGSQDDMSLSQVWIVDGSYSDNSLSTIEVGWQTLPLLHPGDNPNAPHLFIYWTNDAYTYSGCYNLLCAGFVQYSKSWVIGGSMPQYGSTDGNEVKIQVRYCPAGRSWWLCLNDEPIGYWPASIYVNGYMQGTGNQVQWGGEVAFLTEPGQVAHSKTAMGSGAFAMEDWPKAAYQRNITYFDADSVERDPGAQVLDSQRLFDNPQCYDIQVQLSSYINWGTYFFFGGSGGANPACHY